MWPQSDVGDMWALVRPAAMGGAGVCLALLLLAVALWWRMRVLFPLVGAALAAALLPLALHPEFVPFRLLTSLLLPWLGALLFLAPSACVAGHLLMFRGDWRLRNVPSFIAGQSIVLCVLWLLAGPVLVGPAVLAGAMALAGIVPLFLLAALLTKGWRRSAGGGALIAGGGLLAVAGGLLLMASAGVVAGAVLETLYLLCTQLAIVAFAVAPMRAAQLSRALLKVNADLRSSAMELQQENRELTELAAGLENERSQLVERRSALEAENRQAEQRLRELTQTADAFFKLRESIDYAQRIQQALAPSEMQLRETLGESFILNLPRDNVSGDFLWCGKFPDGWSLACVADCTGHGVPGAFMSVLGTMLLNQIVSERNVRRPDQVLFAMDRNLRSALATNGARVDDGMEAAVLLLSPDRRQVLFSGARLCLFRARDGAVTVVEGVRRPIGGRERARSPQFEPRHITLRQGEMLYMASDGFQDQLGGPEGRRYMSQRFRDTLGWVSNLPLKDQRPAIKKVLESWRGEHPQTDDILLVGVQV